MQMLKLCPDSEHEINLKRLDGVVYIQYAEEKPDHGCPPYLEVEFTFEIGGSWDISYWQTEEVQTLDFINLTSFKIVEGYDGHKFFHIEDMQGVKEFIDEWLEDWLCEHESKFEGESRKIGSSNIYYWRAA